jgi:APA family basic amino acid/polyamine antiporter
VFLLLAVNIPTMLKYLFCCLAAFNLVRFHPELHAQAALRWSRGRVQAVAVIGILCALGIIAAGLAADWGPYALVLGWGVAGLVYWWASAKARRAAAA